MGTVVLPKLSQTGANEWADVEDNDKALRDEINGNLENVNVKSTAAIAHSKLAATTAGYVLMGNASNVTTATALSGDVTVNSSGVTAIGSGVIVNADVNSTAAIATTKLGRPTLHNDGSSVSTNLTNGQWNATGATFTADASGLHLIVCSGYCNENAGSSGLIEVRSTLGTGIFTPFGVELRKSVYVGGTPGIDIEFVHCELAALTSGDVVSHALWPNNTIALDVASNAFAIKAVCLTA